MLPDCVFAPAQGQDRGVDSDHSSPGVDQRAAGVARIDRCIGLDPVDVGGRRIGLVAGADHDRAVLGADDALGDGAGQSEGRAHRDDGFAHLTGLGVADGDGLERSTRGDLDHRHVVARTAADQAGHRAAAVGEGDGDPAAVGGPRDDVIVGHDPTRVVEHEAGAGRAAEPLPPARIITVPGRTLRATVTVSICRGRLGSGGGAVGSGVGSTGVGSVVEGGSLGGAFALLGPTGPGVAVRAANRAPPNPAAPPTTSASRAAVISSAAPVLARDRGAGAGGCSGGNGWSGWTPGRRRVVRVAGTGEEGTEVSGVAELSLADLPAGRPVSRGRSSSAIGRLSPVFAGGGASENRESGPTPPERDPS